MSPYNDNYKPGPLERAVMSWWTMAALALYVIVVTWLAFRPESRPADVRMEHKYTQKGSKWTHGKE